MGTLRTEAEYWQDPEDPQTSIRQLFNEHNDSVTTYRNDHPTGSFLVHNGTIVSDRFVRTDENGHLLSIDSFRVSTNSREESYFGNFKGSLRVRWKYYPTGIPSEVIYRDSGNWTTGYTQWGPTGIIRQRMNDGTIYQYSETGVLTWQQQRSGYERLIFYYDNGVIRSSSIDTLVKNQVVRYECDYSSRGILLKESWLKNKKPCETWREYSPEGVLIRTIKHPPLEEMPEQLSVEGPAFKEIYTYVEQMAEYPGGIGQLRARFEPALQAIFCDAKMALSGKYLVRFSVRQDGSVDFIGVEGQNAEAIKDPIAALVQSFPKWNPAKRNGRAIKVVEALSVEVKPM